MPSRKRSKGKERKAKKEKGERELVKAFWRNFCRSIECNHGCGCGEIIISEDHPVSSFMDTYFGYEFGNYASVEQHLVHRFQTHTHIWTNESYKKMAMKILIRVGANMLLNHQSFEWPACIAHSILVFEHYNGTDDIEAVTSSKAVVSKGRKLATASSSRRDALKFFRKRTSCKCLKKMHLEARKSTQKMGWCYNCNKVMERAALYVCSRCMIEKYCSRECQLADWPAHKFRCY